MLDDSNKKDKSSTLNETDDTNKDDFTESIEDALWDMEPSDTLYEKVKDKFKKIINLKIGGA